jgi:hypothetical protein
MAGTENRITTKNGKMTQVKESVCAQTTQTLVAMLLEINATLDDEVLHGKKRGAEPWAPPLA